MTDSKRIDLDKLTTEARNPRSEALDTMSAEEIVRMINAEDATVAAAGKQADDAGKRTGLVIYEHGKRVLFRALGFLGDEIGGAGGLKLGVHEAISVEGRYGGA